MIVGSSSCKFCTNGQYQGVNGQSSCKACATGQNTAVILFKASASDTSIKNRNTGGNYCSSYGYNVISTQAECWQARQKLNLGHTGYSSTNGPSGSWSWLPQGCVEWSGTIRFNTYGQYRTCNYNSNYCICKKSKIHL